MNGMATLSPLRFHYDSREFSLPIRLGLANSRRHAGPDRQHPRARPALRGRELHERHDPDEPRRQGRRAASGSASSTRRCSIARSSRTRRGGHRVRVGRAAAAIRARARRSTATISLTLGGDVLAVDVQGHERVLRLRADAAARALRQGHQQRPRVPRRRADRRRPRASPTRRASSTRARSSAGSNNFQGRYAIRHPWTGAIACANPVRGRWGGPNGQTQQIATPATNLAFAPRGAQLSTFIAGDVPAITPLASGGAQLPNPVRQPQGCGCRAEGGAQGLVGFALLGLVLRRRPRR